MGSAAPSVQRAPGVPQRAQAVAAAVADMIEAGDAASAGPLARRAVERVTAALMYMDDSAGIVGDDLRTLMALYAPTTPLLPRPHGDRRRWSAPGPQPGDRSVRTVSRLLRRLGHTDAEEIR